MDSVGSFWGCSFLFLWFRRQLRIHWGSFQDDFGSSESFLRVYRILRDHPNDPDESLSVLINPFAGILHYSHRSRWRILQESSKWSWWPAGADWERSLRHNPRIWKKILTRTARIARFSVEMSSHGDPAGWSPSLAEGSTFLPRSVNWWVNLRILERHR